FSIGTTALAGSTNSNGRSASAGLPDIMGPLNGRCQSADLTSGEQPALAGRSRLPSDTGRLTPRRSPGPGSEPAAGDGCPALPLRLLGGGPIRFSLRKNHRAAVSAVVVPLDGPDGAGAKQGDAEDALDRREDLGQPVVHGDQAVGLDEDAV